jgi:hypothetical protein
MIEPFVADKVHGLDIDPELTKASPKQNDAAGAKCVRSAQAETLELVNHKITSTLQVIRSPPRLLNFLILKFHPI